MSISAIRPRIGDRLALSGLWITVIAATFVYWESCRLANGGAKAIDLHRSGLWMIEIWSGWLVLSFPAFEQCRRWRQSAGGLRLHRALALMAGVSILALCSEWLLNAAMAELGGIKRLESVWDLLNRRALLGVVVSGAIVLLAARPIAIRRKPVRDEPSNTDAQEVRNDPLLVLMGRDGPITVSPHDIEAILAAENYVQVCMAGGKQYLHRTTLATIERELSSATMLRVHRSAIVNIDQVSDRLPGWRLQLASGRVIRVGRSFRQAFEQGTRMIGSDSSQ